MVAAGLARLGVRHGDRVLLMMRNRAEFVLSWLGGCPARRRAGPDQRRLPRAVLRASRQYGRRHGADRGGRAPRYVDGVGRQARAPSYRRCGGRRAARTPARDPRDRRGSRRSLGHADDTREAAAVAPSDVGAIHFTSGTSGPSKGAVLPHAHLHLLSERNRELLDLRTGDTYLTELPLFHINAQMSVYSALLVGARVRIEQRFSASSWLDRVRASNATHTSLLGVHAGVHPQAARPAGGCRHRCSGAPGRCPVRPTSRPPSATASGSRRSSRRTGAPRSAWSPGERSTRRRARSDGSTPISTRPGSWTSQPGGCTAGRGR